jgi:hypothetical protein
MPIGVDPGGHQRGGVDHPAVLTHLDHQRIQPHKRVRAGVQRPVPPRRHDLVELGAHPADLRLGDAVQAHRAGNIIHPAGRHALHIALRDHRGQRLLRPPARLQHRRQVAAVAHPGDRQLDRARPGVPIPRPVAVAMRHTIQGALAMLSTNLLADLGFHQRLASTRTPSRRKSTSPASALLTSSSSSILDTATAWLLSTC